MNTSVWEKGETRRIAEVALSNQPPKLVIPNGFSHEESAFFYLQRTEDSSPLKRFGMTLW
jgi:hypothetical protein